MPKFFVTGGSGFIGSHVIKQLKQRGHEVLALARSDSSAAQVKALGAEVLRGNLEDVEVLKQGAKSVDGGVIHLAFNHEDFDDYSKVTELDFKAVKSFGEALKGTNKALIITSDNLSLAHPVGSELPDEFNNNFDEILKSPIGGRLKTELYTLDFKNDGIRASVIRLSPTVHDSYASGFATVYLGFSIKNGEAGYIGDGLNAWPSIHVEDAASLFVLAAEKGVAGQAYHGIGEESITIKEMAEVIAKKYNLPLKSYTSVPEAMEKYAFLGGVLGMNNSAKSDFTQKSLGWTPKGRGLLEDLRDYDYVEARKKYGLP